MSKDAELLSMEQVLLSAGMGGALPSCLCRNGAMCRQRVQLLPRHQVSVQTDSTVFIAPAFTFTYYCACALGYTGTLNIYSFNISLGSLGIKGVRLY